MYIYTYVRTYVRTYVHTYIHTLIICIIYMIFYSRFWGEGLGILFSDQPTIIWCESWVMGVFSLDVYIMQYTNCTVRTTNIEISTYLV